MDGQARLGKTFAAKAWCDLHPGRARYVEVHPMNDDSGFFRAIARSLGISIESNAKSHRLRDRIEQALLPGHLVLVLDEAHRLWPQTNLHQRFPTRINWLMSLCNRGVPVVLVTTPQFMRSQKEIEARTCWTSEQFIGRIGHYSKLPDVLTAADLQAVAEAMLPDGDARSFEALVLYAQSSAKYLAGIDTAVARARFIAGREQRGKVLFADIKRAIRESVIPSDKAFVEAMQAVDTPARKRAARVFATPLQPDFRAPEFGLPAPRSDRGRASISRLESVCVPELAEAGR